MSFYQLPHPWDPGYVIPEYVMAEPPERGTFTTQWLPRGTISELVPDYLAKPGRKLLGRNNAGLSGSPNGMGSLGGCSLAGHSLAGHALRGSSLSGDTLGARAYTLMPTGADLQEVPPAKTQEILNPGGSGSGSMNLKPIAIGAAVIAGAFLLFGGKKRR